MLTREPSAVGDFRPSDRVVRAGDVIWRRVDDEVVILNEDGTTLTTLNLTAAMAWEAMDGELTVAEIASSIAERFEVSESDVLDDVLELCDGLAGESLVSRAGASQPTES